ncbi:MAG TPA: 1-acyl-sn-glycerol-3-phosphate acyltransferase [Oligoflexus sp.]|uniref:1-acyl-sn-glycerol-3-phosphate acyltransferase n=1 Tax=Oligoflexus sp. TaxID=1971216 RepID=UPI002D3DEC03|nr:1-acyl-sn-glycerol-3-phosphate acyltransferase [Oligoflexus sp.]HYX39771.1 1-acyl-sn-glycerol-3-phosphate acyltransferase [Oligoflexus sp.]
MELAARHRISLRVQKFWGYINLIWFGPLFLFLLRFVGGYQCLNREAVRAKLEGILRAHPGRPVLLCANHMTMIDSMLITRFLFPFPSLFSHFERFPWNIPELQNFGANPFTRLMCYLGKCVYVERSGSVESRKLSWSKVTWLNQEGDFICVFPEGGRTRIGRVDRDAAVYGVGQLLQDNPKTLVICVYLRGVGQENFSFFPRYGEQFFIDVEACDCKVAPGRRGQKDITMQMFDSLENMEKKYFAARQ